jgi:hypothetical protein
MTGMRAEAVRKGMAMGEVRMLIDGELTEAASARRFDNINPSTEEVIGDVADADLGRQCGREGFEQYLETKAMAWMP